MFRLIANSLVAGKCKSSDAFLPKCPKFGSEAKINEDPGELMRVILDNLHGASHLPMELLISEKNKTKEEHRFYAAIRPYRDDILKIAGQICNQFEFEYSIRQSVDQVQPSPPKLMSFGLQPLKGDCSKVEEKVEARMMLDISNMMGSGYDVSNMLQTYEALPLDLGEGNNVRGREFAGPAQVEFYSQGIEDEAWMVTSFPTQLLHYGGAAQISVRRPRDAYITFGRNGEIDPRLLELDKLEADRVSVRKLMDGTMTIQAEGSRFVLPPKAATNIFPRIVRGSRKAKTVEVEVHPLAGTMLQGKWEVCTVRKDKTGNLRKVCHEALLESNGRARQHIFLLNSAMAGATWTFVVWQSNGVNKIAVDINKTRQRSSYSDLFKVRNPDDLFFSEVMMHVEFVEFREHEVLVMTTENGDEVIWSRLEDKEAEDIQRIVVGANTKKVVEFHEIVMDHEPN